MLIYHILLIIYSFIHYSYPTILTLFLCFYLLLTFSYKKLYAGNSQLFILLILWQITTFVFYFVSSYSSRLTGISYLIIATLSFYLIPQIVFFNFGAILPLGTLRKVSTFYVNINFFAISIGIIDFFTFKVLYQQPYILGGILPEKFYRMQSYFGTAMIAGCVCSTSLLLTLFICQNKFKRYIYTLVFIIGLALTGARGAWVAGFVSLCYYLYMSKSIKLKISSKLLRFIIFIVLIILFCLPLLGKYFNSENFVQVGRRFSNLFNASGERESQWLNGINIFLEHPLGVGYGLLTHKGINSNFGFIVADGNYFRILGELGIIGFILFLILLIYSIIIAHRKKYYIVTALLLIYSIQAVGTNVFDIAYTSYLFWLLIGLSFNIKYKEEAKEIIS